MTKTSISFYISLIIVLFCTLYKSWQSIAALMQLGLSKVHRALYTKEDSSSIVRFILRTRK